MITEVAKFVKVSLADVYEWFEERGQRELAEQFVYQYSPEYVAEMWQEDVDFMRGLMQSVCAFMKVEVDQILSKTRKAEVAMARHIFFAVVRHYRPRISLSRLGDFMNRDHATALHGIRKINDVLYSDKTFRRELQVLLARLIDLKLICDMSLTANAPMLAKATQNEQGDDTTVDTTN